MEWWQILAYICWYGIIIFTCVLVWAEGADRLNKKAKNSQPGEDHSADVYEYSKHLYDVCDACGKYPKRPNSQLCKNCEDKISDN